jgi:hypothetical protein
MTSLTTLCATSDLMHLSDEGRHAARIAASDTAKPMRIPSRSARSLCAVLSVVISMSLLGSVAVGITMPTTGASVIADAESA